MKLRACLDPATPVTSARAVRRREEGMAVMVVIALLAIILIFIAGTARTLHYLGRDVKLIEQQQIQRLNCRQAKTNALPAATRSTALGTPPATGPH